ncbi:MAG: aspartate kinase [Clostridia bacterium]|nr:aspartate kinase [Clostridia bacterium]
MALKVLKFGGSSLADAGQFRRVANIVKAESDRRYVVPSAPGKRFSGDDKVTDLLYRCYDASSNGEPIDEIFTQIEERYNQIIRDLGLSISLAKEFEKIRASILHLPGRDYVASRGEYLSGIVLAAYLGYDFIDAAKVIFFFDNGLFDAEKTNRVLSETLSKHERAVVPGFYGSMPNGTIKTFSRGGSDVTGSIVARAAKADIYENWTDVSGFLMADPRCVENPQVIDVITYKELRELSYMGATVLHEDAIFPVRFAKIPINIKNTNDPAAPGTMIVDTPPADDLPRPITGIAGKMGFSIITVEKDMMSTELGFGRRMLEALEMHGISFEHLPSGIDTISVVVASSELEGKREPLLADIRRMVSPDVLHIEDNIALLAVVGRGMVKTKGTAARIFRAISEASINIRIIDQGSSELNVILGVEEKDYLSALKAIYREFVG